MREEVETNNIDIKKLTEIIKHFLNIPVEIKSDTGIMSDTIIRTINIADNNILLSCHNDMLLELPVPFTFYKIANGISLDYTVNAFKSSILKCNRAKTTELIDSILIKEQQNIKKSKFFDIKINIIKK